MEVIHYLREVRQLMSPADKIEKSFYDCFYFSSLEVLLYTRSTEEGEEKTYELAETGPMISEARYIARGKNPKRSNVDIIFSDIKKMDGNKAQIRDLIETVVLKGKLEISLPKKISSLEEKLKNPVPITLS